MLLNEAEKKRSDITPTPVRARSAMPKAGPPPGLNRVSLPHHAVTWPTAYWLSFQYRS